MPLRQLYGLMQLGLRRLLGADTETGMRGVGAGGGRRVSVILKHWGFGFYLGKIPLLDL